ncbi:hypothetical protein PRIEUP_LOCUS1483 [Pristimantis euphronides]
MRSWELSVLLFSAVALHGCLANTAEPEVQDERYNIQDAIDLYNQREEVTYLYKLLEQRPSDPLEEDENFTLPRFTIKETECQKSGNPDLSLCAFKPDGDVKVCAVDPADEDPEDIFCMSVTKGVRVRRSTRRPCRRRPCGPRLIGAFSFMGRPASNQKKPDLKYA